MSKVDIVVRDDKETWLYHGTRQLFFKICLFLELKGVPLYLNLFIQKFGNSIEDKVKAMKDRGPLFNDSEPSMINHDDFRDFLSGFPAFQHNRKADTNKLKLILEHTQYPTARFLYQFELSV